MPVGIVGTAVAIAAAGHGAATGRVLDLGVVTMHVLAAGIWVGGLVVLVALGRSVERRAVQQFSVLAMASVVALVATGVLNSLQHVHSWDQLLLTRYGLLLVVKLMLVGSTLAAAAVSRQRVRQDRAPLQSVRVEALLTVAVLTVTAVLSMTSPPPKAVAETTRPAAGRSSGASAAANAVVQMSLADQGNAALGVIPATTTGSRLHLLLTGPNGRPVKATQVLLKMSNPGRNVDGIPVRMSARNDIWVGRFQFPFTGVWKATLTVQGAGPSAVVTAGEVTVNK